MITHIVSVKLKDPSEENITAAISAIEGLEGKIPSLRGVEVGRDVIRSERSYDLALIARFDDLDGLQAYQIHPEHQPVLKKLRELAASVIAVDFES